MEGSEDNQLSHLFTLLTAARSEPGQHYTEMASLVARRVPFMIAAKNALEARE